VEPKPWTERVLRAFKEEIGGLNFRLILAHVVMHLLPSHHFPRLRTTIYRLAGFRIGPRSLIFGRMEFTGSTALQRQLSIGADTMVNVNCFIDLNAQIHIGDRAAIGHHVTFVTADHDLGSASCRAGVMRPKPIIIEDGCWIGANSMILPGVRLGHGSIVSAGSVVSGSVPPDRMVGGVPARPLKTLSSGP
jgi:maltose O-acetyltransferase